MNALSCVGCAGPTFEASRLGGTRLGATSSDAVIGLALAGVAAIVLFKVMAPKKRGALAGIFGRSRRRRRR